MHHFKSIGEFKLDLQSRNAQCGSKLVIFYPVWPSLKIDVWPWKTIGHLFCTTPSFVHHFKAIGEVKPELLSGNALVGSKLVIFLYRVTLKFDLWPWKTPGHLFSTTLSFVHHSKAMGEFKLELQSGNTQFGSKSIFLLCDLKIWWMTLKNNRTPHLCYFKFCASFRTHWWIQTWVLVRKRPIWVKIDDFFSRDLQTWRMTFKNNRAPPPWYFKLCASFCSHWWIQTGVTVQKRPIWVKFDDFWSRVTLQFEGWSWKTIGHLFHATSSFVHHFVAIGEFKLELQSRNAQSGSNSIVLPLVTWTFDLWLRPFAWMSLLSLVIKPENFMMIQWWEHSQKGVTGGRTDGLNHS